MGVFRTWLEDFATALTPLGTTMRDFQTHTYQLLQLPNIRVKPGGRKKGNDIFKCRHCHYEWQRPKWLGKPSTCPNCGSFDLEIENGRF